MVRPHAPQSTRSSTSNAFCIVTKPRTASLSLTVSAMMEHFSDSHCPKFNIKALTWKERLNDDKSRTGIVHCNLDVSKVDFANPALRNFVPIFLSASL